ncbi:MAG: response regulator, partial [Lachnospiraceae bacterium]|nr:response regulator [Lachnospiraceae bacterium]
MYKVYLVDDDGLILEEMATTVAWLDNGFEVAGSNTNPLKAIDEIRTLSPDVIFCDLKMPVMDGNEFIRQLREDGVNAEFVMVSAYNDFENVRTFFKQTGFDYILKPIDQEEIQPVLERLSEKLSRI